MLGSLPARRKNMNVYSFEHAPFETPALFTEWIQQRGHSLHRVFLWNNDPLPDSANVDMLLVMGGPMNIYEEKTFPWLKKEKETLKRIIEQKKIVVGICLGAQLICDVLGGTVTKNEYKEIGWFPVVQKNAHPLLEGIPHSFYAFHWHSDRFSIPENALHLFGSAGCDNQGFVYGNHVVGLQFHLEMNDAGLKKLLENCADDITAGKYVMYGSDIINGALHVDGCKKILFGLLDTLESFTR